MTVLAAHRSFNAELLEQAQSDDPNSRSNVDVNNGPLNRVKELVEKHFRPAKILADLTLTSMCKKSKRISAYFWDCIREPVVPWHKWWWWRSISPTSSGLASARCYCCWVIFVRHDSFRHNWVQYSSTSSTRSSTTSTRLVASKLWVASTKYSLSYSICQTRLVPSVSMKCVRLHLGLTHRQMKQFVSWTCSVTTFMAICVVLLWK